MFKGREEKSTENNLLLQRFNPFCSLNVQYRKWARLNINITSEKIQNEVVNHQEIVTTHPKNGPFYNTNQDLSCGKFMQNSTCKLKLLFNRYKISEDTETPSLKNSNLGILATPVVHLINMYITCNVRISITINMGKY